MPVMLLPDDFKANIKMKVNNHLFNKYGPSNTLFNKYFLKNKDFLTDRCVANYNFSTFISHIITNDYLTIRHDKVGYIFTVQNIHINV